MALEAKSKRSVKLAQVRPRKTLAQEVADELKEAIISTKIALGETLSEERVATQMGVSRTPVREAFSILQHQGLLTVLPRRGSVVFRPDARDIKMLVDFRRQMELGAAKLAMQNAPEATTEALQATIERMDQARRDDKLLAYTQADDVFHRTFFDHCANPYYTQAYDLISGRISALRAHLSVPLQIYRTRAYDEHLAMGKAAAEREEDRLIAILSEHIEAMTGNYVLALASL
ncbi:GntR family transcriptional regulator [Paracoccus sp. (in: a-proteobacteria)]|uniref:GntR family transcriptional regulator n=1 Tax=Paracoccus sp. TaxID=267 RepID=UPI0032203357